MRPLSEFAGRPLAALALSAAFGLGVGLATPAQAALFDFSSLLESNDNGGADPGDIGNQNAPSFQFNENGVIVTVSTPDGSGQVGVIDTNVAVHDPDLRGLFDDIDDDDGNDGVLGGPTEIAETGFGNALIVQEAGSPAPDDNARGGTLTFTFSQALKFDYVDLLDIEERSTVKLFDAGNTELFSMSRFVLNAGFNGDGPNQWARFDVPGIGGVTKMEVIFGGSGAIGQFAAAVPLPAGVLLLTTALGGMGLAARRQRRRAQAA